MPENPAPITTTRIWRKFSTGRSLIFSFGVSVVVPFGSPLGMSAFVDSPFARMGRGAVDIMISTGLVVAAIDSMFMTNNYVGALIDNTSKV